MEAVLDRDAQPLTPATPDYRARHLVVVGPDRGVGVRAADEVRTTGSCDQTILGGRGSPRVPRQCRGGCRGATRREEDTAR